MSYQKKVFFISFILFIIHQWNQKVMGLHWSLIDNHLDPLLCMPICLGIFEWQYKGFFPNGINWLTAMLFTLILSIIFEIGFSAWHPGFTADPIDFILYFLGSQIYLGFKEIYQITRIKPQKSL